MYLNSITHTLCSPLQPAPAQAKAADVNQKLVAADETKKSINEKREQFRPVATRGSVLYFSVVELSLVNVMYQTSLDQFLEIFMGSMDRAEKASLASKRFVARRLLLLSLSLLLLVHCCAVVEQLMERARRTPRRRSRSDAASPLSTHLPVSPFHGSISHQSDQHHRDHDVHVLPVHQPRAVREGQAYVRATGHHEDPHHGRAPQDHGPYYLPQGRGRARHQLGMYSALPFLSNRPRAAPSSP